MTSARQGHVQETPVRLSTQHGYRLDGDQVHLHAELELPRFSGGKWALELWACDGTAAPPLAGTRVAKLTRALPATLTPLAYSVEGSAVAELPPHGSSYAMALVLREELASGESVITEIANYPRREIFPSPHFDGGVGYRVLGDEVELTAQSIANPRAPGSSSGSLKLELWAERADAEHCLSAALVSPVHGQFHLPNFVARAPFVAPPVGTWRLSLRLREWAASGFITRDSRAFDAAYVSAEPEPVVPAKEAATASVAASAKVATAEAAQAKPAPNAEAETTKAAAPAPAAVSAAAAAAASAAPAAAPNAATVTPAEAPVARASEAPAPAAAPAAVAAKVEPVATPAPAAAAKAEPVAAPAAAAAAAAAKAEPAATPAAAAAAKPSEAPVAAAAAEKRLSLQTASAEEISEVTGLALKVAKEIVKSRPFKAFEDLMQIKGIGDRTLQAMRKQFAL